MKSIPVKLPHKRVSGRAVVDDEDYELLMKYKWYFSSGYAVRWLYFGKKDGKTVQSMESIHRTILGLGKSDKSIFVDHINGNRLDNRRQNLRLCTAQQNAWNSGARKTSKTGKKGVSKNGGGFMAQIRIKGRTKHLGTYRTVEEASQKYISADKEIHGEFAYTYGRSERKMLVLQ